MTSNSEKMRNGETRHRLVSDDGTAYIRTEASRSGGWQKAHYHLSCSELYIVQKGWCLLACKKGHTIRYRRYGEGEIFSVPPKIPHTVYLSKNAVTHTVKFGRCAANDWHELSDFDSQEKRLPKIKRAILQKDVDAVSFDVFDTLVIRPFLVPSDMFMLLGDDFPRRNAEELARKRQRILNPDYDDITLDEIYDELRKISTVSPEKAEELKQKEVELEIQNCSQRKSAFELFETAKNAGKKIIITSDMYLPSVVIEKILHNCGYDGWDFMFVSGEHRKSKQTGRLYKVLEEKCGIPARRILHVGDNRQADIKSAKKAGLRVSYLPKLYESERHSEVYAFLRKIYRTLFPAKRRRTVYEALSHNEAVRFAAEESCASFKNLPQAFVDTSSYVSAPVLFSYVLWVLQTASAQGIRRLYFLARDGYVLYLIAKKICRSLNFDIELRYFYASRIALRYPLYHKLGKKSAEYIFVCTKGVTRRALLERLLLSREKESEVRDILGFEDSSLSLPLSCEELQKIKSDFLESERALEIVLERSMELYKTAVGYIRQEGLLENIPSAIVDSGWSGSLQVFLNKLLESLGGKPVPGFYFGMISFFSDDKKEKYYPYCFTPDDKKFLRYFNNNIVECMCSAPTGSTLFFQEKDGHIEPCFTSAENANNTDWYIHDQIEIINRFAERYLDICAHLKIPLKETGLSVQTVKNLLGELMYNPTKEEAEVYGSYLFSDDFTEKKLVQLAPKMTYKEAAQNDIPIKLFRKIMRNKIEPFMTFWFLGSLRRSKIKFFKWHRLNAVFLSLYIQLKSHKKK